MITISLLAFKRLYYDLGKYDVVCSFDEFCAANNFVDVRVEYIFALRKSRAKLIMHHRYGTFTIAPVFNLLITLRLIESSL